MAVPGMVDMDSMHGGATIDGAAGDPPRLGHLRVALAGDHAPVHGPPGVVPAEDRDPRLAEVDRHGLRPTRQPGFGLAFAVGGIVTGLIADRISPRWFYPIVLMGWSGVGFATGWVTNYWELSYLPVAAGILRGRTLLACAHLVTSQRLPPRAAIGRWATASSRAVPRWGRWRRRLSCCCWSPTRRRAGDSRSASSARSACSGSSAGWP